MKPLASRPLTAGERGFAAEMFGAGLDAGRVRIFAIPLWRRAFVAGPGLIVWPAATVRPDFAAPQVPLRVQAVFVHELTHVWQAQHGVSLILAKIKAGDSLASYAYDLQGGRAFTAMNIEQQAMVVEHAFIASRGGETPHPAPLYAAASAQWRQT
ncbi:MAG: hypothetical protein EPO51_13125 [Phenylobacterium sp.]|uniref:hypothetical protein n=1 Tax=Phenylobacterium sp. TaxID=1871053 RepID=UPI00121ECD7E|nr:hypothetical protein [Phenylobacterium sp.]TAJ71240.1 MAG: hypothetical protein EPO51_13125 [Phenylobacterium sp.]